jgi:hypothetical protein
MARLPYLGSGVKQRIARDYPVGRISNQSHVYFIRGGDFIKIGVSGDPLGRLADLQVSSPYLLELIAVIPGNRDEEFEIQKLFLDLYVRGEWFRDDPSIHAFLRDGSKKKRRNRKTQRGAK